jgi:Rrf2 family protein
LFLKISDAANLGFHSLVYLAQKYEDGSPVATIDAAKRFNVSANHLSKVLQRLTRARLVKSVRGPKGGFVLAKEPSQITLKDIYEAIDGPIVHGDTCLLDKKRCELPVCIMGSLIGDIERQVIAQFEETTLEKAINRR